SCWKGAVLGMAMNQIISLVMSYILGLGYYAPCLAGLGEVFGGELNAALAQAMAFAFVFGVAGMLRSWLMHQGSAARPCFPVNAESPYPGETADIIRETGLPTTLTGMGMTDERVLRAVADTCKLTADCCRRLTRNEVFDMLKECL
ncbi:MAG: hypothetical protein ACI4MK_04360, partial [Aristaeellaceae bacterium]